MKLSIFYLTIFILLSSSCRETKTIHIASNPTINTDQKHQNNIVKIRYQALSRGFYLQIELDKNVLLVSTDRNHEQRKQQPCKTEDWNNIILLTQKIQLDKLQELKAPTENRLFDGAAHAQLYISNKEKEYISSGFDHGAPPEEIAPLVSYILSLGETVEKQ
ncbi:hypothetical protein ACFSTE_00150 [Aquimarina hainanensis]|uniref:Lipoprotein n=1 Tax=Aquimarina hainanensis TaxID=1578017 RepID=A0ABW5N0Q8_9FLAO